ncbi:MAG: hypothetical protein O2931_18090, partial [Planctomycetota bacterium]|nr:hypothetical protein [Planctomycetota bacterium]
LIADLAAIQQGRLPYPKSAVFRPVQTTPLRKLVPWLAPAFCLLLGLLATEIYFSVSTKEPQDIPEFQGPHSSESTVKLSQDSPSAIVPTPPSSDLPTNTSAVSAVNDVPQSRTDFDPNPEKAPAVAANISRIIVASQHRRVPDAYVAVTIDEAFEYCQKNPNISQIALELNGPTSVSRTTRFTQENLTITAADGFQPTIIFSSGKSPQDSLSIQIASGRITWKHLHLVWNVPKSLSEPRSVFSLEDGVHCTFQHCTLTLRDDDQLGPYRKNLTWLSVISPSPTVPPEPTIDTVQPTSIEVEDSYVRGEGSLLEVQSGARISLAVRQTAILLTESLFRFQEPQRGIAHRDANRVTLQNVMAVCRSGLGIINTGFDGSAIPAIHVEIAQSVVALPTDFPLFLHQGNGEMQDYLRSLHYQGNRNIYRGPGNFWEVNARGDDHHDTFSWSQWKSRWQATNPEAEFQSQYLPLASAFTTTQPLSAVPIDALRYFLPSLETFTNGSTPSVGAQLYKIHVAKNGPLLDTKPRIP